jgi:hypothetical protein
MVRFNRRFDIRSAPSLIFGPSFTWKNATVYGQTVYAFDGLAMKNGRGGYFCRFVM